MTFPSRRAFDKESRRLAFLMLQDLEMPAKPKAAYLKLLLKLNVHKNIESTWKYFHSTTTTFLLDGKY